MHITISEDTTFLIADELGDIPEGAELGLYHQDTRFLCRYELRLNGQRPLALGARATDYYAAAHFLTNLALGDIARGALAIVRERLVGQGLHEDIYVTNYGVLPTAFVLSLSFDVDFAHIFQVKTQIEVHKETVCTPSELSCEVAHGGRSMHLRFVRDGFIRRTTLNFSLRPAFGDGGQLASFPIALGPGEIWHLCVDVLTLARQEVQPRYTCRRPRGADEEAHRLRREQAYLSTAPRLETDHYILQQAYEQSLRDLAALRIRGEEVAAGEVVLAAGIPWFMAIFGRDSLITSYQAMPFYPDAARSVLRLLARHQGSKVDPLSGEEPGKILHEHRFGEAAGGTEIVPKLPYYGTIDATPLFLVTLSEYYRLTGDLSLVRGLKANVLRALEWMASYGDRDGDGYLEYLRETARGLANQGWKDSWDAVRFANGRLAEAPIALCEVQGYAYDARLRSAELLEALGENSRAAEQGKQAATLKGRFNRDFWLPERQFFALALDRDKRKVDAITSNPGHLLWSGIVDDEKAPMVARRLLSPELFSGWGVRTMATTERAYNPISYHNGSVWPHDNSIIAAGLARYGFREEALRIIAVMLEAASRFSDFQPPELFCGYARSRYDFPVEYPTASRPQAWASGAVLLMLTTLLGLNVAPGQKRILLAPLPSLPGLGSMRLSGLRVAYDTLDVEAASVGGALRIRATHVPAGFSVEMQGSDGTERARQSAMD